VHRNHCEEHLTFIEQYILRSIPENKVYDEAKITLQHQVHNKHA